MLRFSLALLCFASASALKVAAPAAISPALKLRGGGDLGSAVVTATAAIGGATGVSMYLGTEAITNVIWLGLNKFPHDKYIAMAMIGWAVGKFHAVQQGPDSAKRFAKLNCIPLALWLLTNVKGGAALTTSIMPGALLVAYVYAGFFD